MQLEFRQIYSKKRFPLRISRGIREGGTNLYVGFHHDGYSGWGEATPGLSEGAETAGDCQYALESFWTDSLLRLSIHEIYRLGRSDGVPPCALAALEMALWDYKARKAGLSLYDVLGLPLAGTPTSLTIGINPPEVVAERVPLLLEGSGARVLKIKLGSPEGTEADRDMFRQVVESCKPYPGVRLRVDANGGWTVDQAISMMGFLASHGVEYVEQPLPEGAEDGLPYVFKGRALPIFLDESCRFADQIPKLAPYTDGVNIKLMKCGGITEALRIASVAQAHGLSTMIGCMGESSIGIAAAVAISGCLDFIDLDSHLNLDPDPAQGLQLLDGIVFPSAQPGHGARLRADA